MNVKQLLLPAVVSLLVLYPGSVQADNTIYLKDSLVPFSIGHQVMILEDAGRSLTFEDILKDEYQNAFKLSSQIVPNFGRTSSAYWVKFDLFNSAERKWVLELANPFIDTIDLYLQTDQGGFEHIQTGRSFPFTDRSIPGNSFIFKLGGRQDTLITCYLRLYNYILFAPLNVGSEKTILKKDRKNSLFFAGYFGFVLMILLYNLIFYYYLGGRDFLFYVVWLLSFATYLCINKGFFIEWFPDLSVLVNYPQILLSSGLIASIFFAKEFLQTKKHVPVIDKILTGLLIPHAFAIILIFLQRQTTASSILQLLFLLQNILFIVAGIRTFLKKYRPAIFYVLAFASNIIFFGIYILLIDNHLSFSGFTVNASFIGQTLDMIFLTMALGHKIYLIRQDKNLAQGKALSLSKENEKLTLEQNARLEQMVNQRTQELRETQQQMIQTEKLASLGQLTAGVAHEIKNPLNFINNFSDLTNELINEFEETSDETEKNEIIQLIQHNLVKIREHGKRADSIVKNMLQHSRENSEEKTDTDINALCEEYLKLAFHGMRGIHADFNCSFTTQLDPSIPIVPVIAQDISRLLLNLFNNGMYATYEKQKRLLINSEGATDNYEPKLILTTTLNDQNVTITIEDNGIGINNEVRNRIFEPFYTTKPSGEGTGLGLSISYDIVSKHNGQIRVESEEGEYTRMIISLPTKAVS